MLHISLLTNLRDLYEFDFIEDKSNKIVVISPHPQLADDMRANILAVKQIETFDSLTISKFVKDELEACLGPSVLEKRVQKADLLLILGTAFKKLFPDKSYELFLNCFTIFTEMRSFTLREDLMDEVLSHYDDDIKKAFIYFWKIVESMGLIDEQNSYKELVEFYHGKNTGNEKCIMGREMIFYGFSHLSGIQIDYIKALSLANNVYLPLHHSLTSSALNYDWLNWLGEEISLKKNGQDILLEEKEKKKLKVIRYTKNRLYEKMKAYNTDQGETQSDKRVNIYLIGKKLSYYNISELPFENVFFKAKREIFKNYLNSEFFEFKKNNKKSTLSFIKIIENKIINELNKEFTDKNFRKLKVFQLLRSELKFFLDQSETNNSLGIFELKLLEYICELKLPRNFNVPMSDNTEKIHIKDIDSLDSFTDDMNSIIVGSSKYRTIKDNNDPFPEEVMEILRTYGPVRRNRVELEIVKYKLVELLKNEKTILFLEEELEKNDPFWEEILLNFSLEEETLQWEGDNNKCDIYESQLLKKEFKIKQLGPSKLQSYMDCPKKYFLDYIQKGTRSPLLKTKLEANQLGSLEHKIIETYFSDFSDWSADHHQELTGRILRQYISKNKIQLGPIDYKKNLDELNLLTVKAIKLLMELQNEKSAKIFFEKEIKIKIHDILFYGIVDCIIDFGDWFGVFDFKRSSSSIPSKKDLLEFEKIQLWSYMCHLKLPKPIKIFGHFNLKDFNSSALFKNNIEDESALESFKSIKISLLRDDIGDLVRKYSALEDDLVTEILNDRSFEASPKNSLTCLYCKVQMLCHKGQGASL